MVKMDPFNGAQAEHHIISLGWAVGAGRIIIALEGYIACGECHGEWKKSVMF